MASCFGTCTGSSESAAQGQEVVIAYDTEGTKVAEWVIDKINSAALFNRDTGELVYEFKPPFEPFKPFKEQDYGRLV